MTPRNKSDTDLLKVTADTRKIFCDGKVISLVRLTKLLVLTCHTFYVLALNLSILSEVVSIISVVTMSEKSPLRVVITGAAGQIAYSLIYQVITNQNTMGAVTINV